MRLPSGRRSGITRAHLSDFPRDNGFGCDRLRARVAIIALIPTAIILRNTNAVRTIPHQLINGYIVSTIASKPTKLIGYAIRRQKNTMNARLFFSPKAASFFVRERAVAMLSDVILREDTSVVNIAPAISTPQTALSPNLSATVKTGIDDVIPSAKTTVWSINSIANRHTHISAQDIIISL